MIRHNQLRLRKRRKETIPVQIIHSIHIELTGYELVQKFFRIEIGKNGDGRTKLTLHFPIQPLA